MVNQLGYTVPTTAAVGNHNKIMALNTAKDTAIRAEQAIYSIIQTASMVGGRSRGGTQALLTAGGVPVMMAPQNNNPAPGQPRPNGYTILRAPPHCGGLRFGSSQRVSVPQAISHNAGDITGASRAGSGSLPVLQATMAPGVPGFSDVALEATEEQEALAVAFLSECTVGDKLNLRFTAIESG